MKKQKSKDKKKSKKIIKMKITWKFKKKKEFVVKLLRLMTKIPTIIQIKKASNKKEKIKEKFQLQKKKKISSKIKKENKRVIINKLPTLPEKMLNKEKRKNQNKKMKKKRNKLFQIFSLMIQKNILFLMIIKNYPRIGMILMIVQ